MNAGLDELKSQVAEKIEEVVPPEDVLTAIKSTTEGLKFAKMIQDAKSKYDIK